MARALWAWTIFLATVVLVAKATIGNFDDSCFNDTIYDLKYTENFTWTADFEVEQDMLSATVLGLAVDLSHPRIGALEIALVASEGRASIVKAHNDGSSGMNMYGAVFRDGASRAFPLEGSQAPFTGTWQSKDALSVLSSPAVGTEGGGGTLTLRIRDLDPFPEMRPLLLHRATLSVCPSDMSTCPSDASGTSSRSSAMFSLPGGDFMGGMLGGDDGTVQKSDAVPSSGLTGGQVHSLGERLTQLAEPTGVASGAHISLPVSVDLDTMARAAMLAMYAASVSDGHLTSADELLSSAQQSLESTGDLSGAAAKLGSLRTSLDGLRSDMLQNVADLLSGPDLSRVTDAALHGFAQEYASSLTDRESLAYKLFGSVSGGSWTPWASHSASEATANSTAPSR